MKHNILIVLALLFIVSFSSCESDNEESSEENWMPLEIGNYWKKGEYVRSEVVDTVRIDGDLFYKIDMRLSLDELGTMYLRIDENQNLIEKFPNNLGYQSLRAKFDIELGDTFYQNDNNPGSDFLGTLMERTDSIMTFRFQRVNHPTLTDEHTDVYINGLGWWYDWDEVKIGDDVYFF